MVKNNDSKRKGLLVVLSASMLLISSVAFFTDRKSNGVRGALGDLSISTNLGYSGHLDNVAPGDNLDMNLNVTNTGSLDAEIRKTYRVSVPEEDISKYPQGGLKLKVDGVEEVVTVNTDVRVPSGVLVAGASTDYALELLIDSKLVNEVQEHNFILEVLTEAKQLNSSDWVELGTDKVKFGGREDFKVVPSSNLIKTSNDNILRTSISELGVSGYVKFFTNKFNRYTPEELKGEFLNLNSELQIYNPSGVLYGVNDVVEVGSIIKLERDGIPYDSLILVSLGDMDSDGQVLINDVTILNDAISKDRGVLGGQVSPQTLITGDLDGDGLLTRNDSRLLHRYIVGGASSLPVHYPQIPYGVKKPDLSFSLGDDTYTDYGDIPAMWNLGNSLVNGSEVSPGKVFKVSVNIDNLRKLNVLGTDFEVLFDSNLVEVVAYEEDGVVYPDDIWYSAMGVGYGLSKENPRTPGYVYHQLHGSKLLDGSGLFFSTSLSNVSSSQFLDGSGSHIVFALRVKDNVPSGTSIDVSFGRTSLEYEGYGDISFHDEWSSSSKIGVVVK